MGVFLGVFLIKVEKLLLFNGDVFGMWLLVYDCGLCIFMMVMLLLKLVIFCMLIWENVVIIVSLK